jgi:hypothetical protein
MSQIGPDGLSMELTDADGDKSVAYLYVSEGQLVVDAQQGSNLVIVKAGPGTVELLKRFAESL